MTIIMMGVLVAVSFNYILLLFFFYSKVNVGMTEF